VEFFVPGGGDIPAVSSGFGAIFSDVDEPDGRPQHYGSKDASTYLRFYDAYGELLYTSVVAPSPGDASLSFLGVRFDANTHPGLPWRFEPEQTRVEVKPGAQTQIFYRAENLSGRDWTGQAAYNVSPDQVGKYFKKIQCFCFTEQTLKAGQKVDMPVLFFVDPAIRQDPDTKDIDEITLSYTFYPVESRTAAR